MYRSASSRYTVSDGLPDIGVALVRVPYYRYAGPVTVGPSAMSTLSSSALPPHAPHAPPGSTRAWPHFCLFLILPITYPTLFSEATFLIVHLALFPLLSSPSPSTYRKSPILKVGGVYSVQKWERIVAYPLLSYC